jgi:hypothetical protein
MKSVYGFNQLTRVGVGDFGHFVGVEPDLALTAVQHGGSEALLNSQVSPIRKKINQSSMFFKIKR